MIPSDTRVDQSAPRRRRWRSIENGVHRENQQGQALAELMVALLALGMLWTAVAWLGRLQDIALQADHAARHLAFLGARQANADWGQVAGSAYFGGQRHRWHDRQGRRLLSDAQSISAQVSGLAPLAWSAQAANQHASGATLRDDWDVADEGVLRASVTVTPGNKPVKTHGPAWADVVRGLDTSYPLIRRYAYILSGAGHANDDAQTRQRVAQASLPWAQAARTSYGLADQVSGRMNRVDQAWRRPAPENDWLYRWQSWLPDSHLQ